MEHDEKLKMTGSHPDQQVVKVMTRDRMFAVERSKWMYETAGRVGQEWIRKYQKGQHEHKTDLGELTVAKLLDELEAEALDTLSYVAEIRRRIVKE